MKLSTDLFGKTYKFENNLDLVKQLKEDMKKAETDFKGLDKEYDRARKKFYVLRKAVEQFSGEKPKATTKATTATETKDNNS